MQKNCEESTQESEIRKWFQRNKIFFETVGAFSISIASIIVAVVSIIVATQTNKMTEENSKISTRLAQLSLPPIVEIDAILESNVWSAANPMEPFIYAFTNQGGPLYAPTLTVYDILKVSRYECDKIRFDLTLRFRNPYNKMEKQTEFMAETEFYTDHIDIPDSSFYLLQFKRPIKFVEFLNKVYQQSIKRPKECGAVTHSGDHIIVLNFQDTGGNLHTNFYRVDSGSVEQMTSETWENLKSAIKEIQLDMMIIEKPSQNMVEKLGDQLIKLSENSS